ncbi:MAG: nitroreductase family protein [Saprospiraceae bacterium]|nr:nitroreductase family protein [Saprospiraceae bacterium]
MKKSEVFKEIVEHRRSNRYFSEDIEVPDESVLSALTLAQLSPNSSNMQLWGFYWIKSKDLLEQMTPLCMGQSAAKTAKHLIVFVTRQGLWKERAEWNYNNVKKAIKGEPTKLNKRGLNYYKNLMPLLYRNDPFGFNTLLRKGIVFYQGLKKPFMRIEGHGDQRVMLHKSCALAAQTFMLAMASEGFDTCPMEGFDAKRVKKHLNLPKDAEITMIVAVGKGTEKGIHSERMRVPSEQVIFIR